MPPSMRAGARGAGESMRRPGGPRSDLPTLRVSNLSQDADDADVRDLFSRFGRVERVFIGRDHETRIGKGFAFVTFEDREEADIARQRVDGLGYDNLILKCNWSGEYCSLENIVSLRFMCQNQKSSGGFCVGLPHFLLPFLSVYHSGKGEFSARKQETIITRTDLRSSLLA